MSEKAFLGGIVGARDMMLRKPQAAQKGGEKPPEKDAKDKKPSPAVDAIKGK